MSQTTDARPSQTTLGGWMIVSGSVLLVVSLFTTMAELRSLDTRRSVEETLAEPPLDTSGISVEGFLQLLHVSALVAGGCAAAMAVLGVYALRRHRPARVLLSVLAVPLFLAGIVAGGLLSSVVAVATVFLWLKPSRDWFDGTPREVPEAPANRTSDDAPTPGSPGTSAHQEPAPPRSEAPWSRPMGEGEATGARPYAGYGASPSTGGSAAGSAAGPGTDTLPRPWGASPSSAPARGDRRTRPPAVLVACLTTWAFSGLVTVLMVGGVLEVLLNPDPFLAEARAQQPETFEQAGLTQGVLVTAIAVMCGILALWAVGAIVVAVLAFRGSPGARTALVVTTATAGVLSLLAGFADPVFLLLTLGTVLTLVCLVRPEVRAWYAGRAGAGR
ncbi:hypothetical protein [uncultured Nocardioides sp.]|uniref:hypothetical protein n=1 Tax=uncultured Nocardioides sp. TaxID=198441 RepID=UPI002639A222|nr:hypothetical protein [uncultured Nocardioides sp.]